jgi:diadenosine tetraphosphatase ApaH/serine/threonine PP2A family protein phosphatase
MRIAVVSDVHSNLEGLEAVLRHAEAGGGIDGVWCLGDLVGYGPQPSEVIARLREARLTAVAGNHDLAACGRMPADEFNRAAADAVRWTGGVLGEADHAFLRALPLTVIGGGVTLVHGSLRSPEWEYLLSPEQAVAHFELQATPYSMVGHSHLPFWVEERRGGMPEFHRMGDGGVLELGKARVIANPGSAGQPRDGDPRAGYVLYDDAAATMTWHRVAYDIASTQRKMEAAGLDRWLIERLALGR